MRRAARLRHGDPRHFTLDTVADAHGALEDRSAAGKIVVDVAV